MKKRVPEACLALWWVEKPTHTQFIFHCSIMNINSITHGRELCGSPSILCSVTSEYNGFYQRRAYHSVSDKLESMLEQMNP